MTLLRLTYQPFVGKKKNHFHFRNIFHIQRNQWFNVITFASSVWLRIAYGYEKKKKTISVSSIFNVAIFSSTYQEYDRGLTIA